MCSRSTPAHRLNVNWQCPLAVLRPRARSYNYFRGGAARLSRSGYRPRRRKADSTGIFAGGATPQAGQILALLLERLKGIEEIDRDSATMTVLLARSWRWRRKLPEDAGLHLALDIGSRGSCQIVCNIATNAGGNHVIRYGMGARVWASRPSWPTAPSSTALTEGDEEQCGL